MDNLGFDDIDEIDTNQMKIYDGMPTKIRRSDMYDSGKTLKQEPTEAESSVKQSVSGKSLLKNLIKQETPINADLMLNTLSDSVGEDVMAGTSRSVLDSIDPLVFDASQPPNSILDDELFSFGGKTGEQEKVADLMVTKYNPKHTHDIQRLASITDYTSHLDNVQNDLESLKDMLRTDNRQLDANQLLGVREDF